MKITRLDDEQERAALQAIAQARGGVVCICLVLIPDADNPGILTGCRVLGTARPDIVFSAELIEQALIHVGEQVKEAGTVKGLLQ